MGGAFDWVRAFSDSILVPWIFLFLVGSTPARASTGPNVIFITLDGVRWNEVFEGSDSEITHAPSEVIMPHLLNDLSQEGMLLGDRIRSKVNVSNPVSLSLPGYQNLFVGKPTFCFTNFCRPVSQETFPERIQSQFHFESNEMAAFASWEQIDRAYSRPGSTLFLNAGLHQSGLSDPIHADIDDLQMREVPAWNRPGIWSARFDRYTFAHAFHYLKSNHPRFLYLSLLDADEYGHAGNYAGYLSALRTYDQWIREIADYLDSSGEYGKNTLLVVTTDHGRGKGGKNGEHWREHGLKFPESRHIWIYLRGLGIQPGSLPLPGTQMNQHSIKSLVLNAFGLKHKRTRLQVQD